jgi:hypothetical protein
MTTRTEEGLRVMDPRKQRIKPRFHKVLTTSS